jgi:hypothetical protein
MKKVHRLRQGIPRRVVGGHYCFDDASLLPFIAGLRCGPTRFRFHFGTHNQNIQCQLQTYGINIKDLILEDGSLSLEWHREWLQIQRVKASRSSNCIQGVIVRPRRFDVLCCQVAHVKQHPGNARLHLLIEMYSPLYDKARKRGEKKAVCTIIVGITNGSYGRFLTYAENDSAGRWGWVEANNEVAIDKIAYFFRYRRRKVKQESIKKLPTKPVEQS